MSIVGASLGTLIARPQDVAVVLQDVAPRTWNFSASTPRLIALLQNSNGIGQ